MNGRIDVNTSLAAVMAMGSQFKVRAEDFAEQAGPASQRVVELVTDPSTYGQDRAGNIMRANHPDSDAIEAIYENHKGLAESAVQIGDNVRTVMALYDGSETRSEADIDGVAKA